MEKRELITDKDGGYSYWLAAESAIDVVKKIHKDEPYFDISKYGIALITKTFTEYEPGRELEFMNIDVMYSFSQVL
jgi:hypothetical protein